MSGYTMEMFRLEFGTDDACLRYLWKLRYSPDGDYADCPKCGMLRAFKRYATTQVRKSWTCTGCGHHLHPTAGTIFHRSSVPLTIWFQLLYLIANDTHPSAKEVERRFGIRYRTASRMLRRIRTVAAT